MHVPPPTWQIKSKTGTIPPMSDPHNIVHSRVGDSSDAEMNVSPDLLNCFRTNTVSLPITYIDTLFPSKKRI